MSRASPPTLIAAPGSALKPSMVASAAKERILGRFTRKMTDASNHTGK
jgi:hypothetical protein